MNSNEYIECFNKKRSPEARKLSVGIFKLFEEKYKTKSPYYDHFDFRFRVSEFLGQLDTNQYKKLSGDKLNRKRDPSPLKNTKIEIKAFPLNGSVHFSWGFLAKDLKNNQKYFWNRTKENKDRRQNKNQIYFTYQEMIDDFLNLELKKYPLTQIEKEKIIKFLEKYGPYFIRFHAWEEQSPNDKEWYFWHFWMDYIHFKKAYETIKSGKPSNFPNAKHPPQTVKKLYRDKNEKDIMKWDEEIGNIQVWFNLCLLKGNLPTKDNSPQDIQKLGRGIGVISNYLNENCKKLITCEYSKCEKTFFQQRKNQSCCCPDHSSKARDKKYKINKKIKKS